MKHKTYLKNSICKEQIANFLTKKATLMIVLICSFVFTSKAQIDNHDDTTLVLGKEAFTVSFTHTPDSSIKFEIINNQVNAITPFFVETYVKGYFLNTQSIEQTLNNAPVIHNIESIFGPQFIGFGLDVLPPLANYKTKFATENRTNEQSIIVIRISGTINGQHVIWSRTFPI